VPESTKPKPRAPSEAAPSEPPADHLGLLRDPETVETPEERAALARIRERLIERVERIDSGARIDPEEPQS
jgi:hypothetical protein